MTSLQAAFCSALSVKESRSGGFRCESVRKTCFDNVFILREIYVEVTADYGALSRSDEVGGWGERY